ncbi:MAG: 2-oxo acid dehydrogenase subunit E2 [Desulfobulbaceae bacterium]|nr:2-oxo acid dehydrogenase subunit E2 [Desulfobulbaceae bacterium]
MRVFKLPDLGEGIHEGEIIEVQVSSGEKVTEGQPILVVETDKAAVEIPSPFTGRVTAIHVKAHDIVHVGDSLMEFSTNGQEDTAGKEKKETSEPAQPDQKTPRPQPVAEPDSFAEKKGRVVPASPATRRLARELGVDLADVKGSGPAGRVGSEDVRAFAERPTKAEQPKKTTKREERIPLRSVRRVIARQMALSWKQIPHVAHMDEADITYLETERKKYKNHVAERGGSLTLTTFALKAAVMALKAYPSFNARLDLEHQEIIINHYYNIGVATDTDRGLVVPVINDVDKKSLVEIAIELPKLTHQAREAKLTVDQLKGGTFTITNIGALGGTSFTPIINYPETAILGMGQARWKPVVHGDDEKSHTIIPRLVLPLVLAFDHRVVDGAQAARFVNLIKEILEDPVAMLFQEEE